MSNPNCTTPECNKPARSPGSTLCPMHYHRAYRHGSVHKVANHSGVTVSHGRRYKTVTAKGHPIARSGGKVYEHRLVLWEAIGPGEHPCYHCQRTVSWDHGKGHPDTLQVDHLNNMGDDNRPENLVPCCTGCNTLRAQQRRSDALRQAGWWSVNDTIAGLKAGGRKPRMKTVDAP